MEEYILHKSRKFYEYRINLYVTPDATKSILEITLSNNKKVLYREHSNNPFIQQAQWKSFHGVIPINKFLGVKKGTYYKR